uniref:Uncharacterized protein n=1 Tax=Oryza rufipogon TaxID=4529 RepID=A0A0E0NJV6_ORYRU
MAAAGTMPCSPPLFTQRGPVVHGDAMLSSFPRHQEMTAHGWAGAFDSREKGILLDQGKDRHFGLDALANCNSLLNFVLAAADRSICLNSDLKEHLLELRPEGASA